MQDETRLAATIARRLDVLEQQNRRLRMAVAAIALVIGGLIVVGAAPSTSETVTARKFLLVDDGGTTLAALGSKAGSPTETNLSFFDERGQLLAFFGVGAGGPTFELHNQGSSIYGIAELGEAIFDLSGGNGVDGKSGGGVSLHAWPDHSAAVMLGPLPSDVGAVLADNEPGRGNRLVLRDKEGKHRLILGEAALTSKAVGGTTKTPVSTITALDKDGNVRSTWP